MQFKTLIFDLDGTLSDSGPGIMNSFRYALDKLHIPYEGKDLRVVVGPPLSLTFLMFGVSEEDTDKAIALYRQNYNKGGKFENEPYEGIEELLKQLRDAGFQLYVATSKPEGLARDILNNFHLDIYFDEIAGATLDRSRESKADVLKYLLNKIDMQDDLVMIGDTVFDIVGAKELGMPAIGVEWGYGDTQEMKNAGAITVVSTVSELINYLMP